jgi:hypothetical protein
MKKMGKLIASYNQKRDVSINVANVRLASKAKGCLSKITAEEIKARRVPAYRYLLP